MEEVGILFLSLVFLIFSLFALQYSLKKVHLGALIPGTLIMIFAFLGVVTYKLFKWFFVLIFKLTKKLLNGN